MLKQRDVVLVFGDIGLPELYALGVIFRGELLARSAVQITKYDQRPMLRKELDCRCTDPIGTTYPLSAFV